MAEEQAAAMQIQAMLRGSTTGSVEDVRFVMEEVAVMDAEVARSEVKKSAASGSLAGYRWEGRYRGRRGRNRGDHEGNGGTRRRGSCAGRSVWRARLHDHSRR